MKTIKLGITGWILVGALLITLSNVGRAQGSSDEVDVDSISSSILTLIGQIDQGLCMHRGYNYETGGCDMEFDGWYGNSDEQFRKKKKRNDRGCIPEPISPAEDANCNASNSKAEHRHDALRASAESSYRDLLKYNFDSANRYICYLVDQASVMRSDNILDDSGYSIIVEEFAEPIAVRIGMDCKDMAL